MTFRLEDIFSVQGKIAVVTGGGTGLGKAIAAGLSENGATVYITGRRFDVLEATAKELNEKCQKGGEVIAIQGDVSNKSSVARLAEQITSKVDKVDVLVNCAGVLRHWKEPVKDFHDSDDVQRVLWEGHDDDDFNYTNSINVNGVYFMTAALVPLLRKSSLPSVIIISSIASLMVQRTAGAISYGISKAAVNQCASLLAARLTPTGIRVNTICPGIFPSEMTGEGDLMETNPGAAKAVGRIPAGRAGTMQEIVGPVLLLSSQAGGYMNNALLTVDGGRVMAGSINDGIKMPEWTNVDGGEAGRK